MMTASSPSRDSRFAVLLTSLFVPVLLMGLSWFVARPLMPRLTDGIPGPLAQNIEGLYSLWTFCHGVIEQGRWPAMADGYRPGGMLGAPYLLLGDQVMAYGTLMLQCLGLGGHATCPLVAYLTDKRRAGSSRTTCGSKACVSRSRGCPACIPSAWLTMSQSGSRSGFLIPSGTPGLLNPY
jgi:hypothetical protein